MKNAETITAMNASCLVSPLMVELMDSAVVVEASTPKLSASIWFISSLSSASSVLVLKIT